MVNKEKEFEHTPNDVVKVLNTLTGSNIKIDEKKGESNMCKAIDDIKKEGERKGKREGKLELLLSLIDEGILSI